MISVAFQRSCCHNGESHRCVSGSSFALSKKISFLEKVLTGILVVVVLYIGLIACVLLFNYVWPDKTDPGNLWYDPLDPRIICKNYQDGTIEYLKCLDTAADLAERRHNQSGW